MGTIITCTEYKKRARARLESGEMSEAEWEEITGALLVASEDYGLDEFDRHVYPEGHEDSHA